jgi:hypothetical protein
MHQIHEPDIARTLCLLLPVHGTPKTLRELRDQVRLLEEIRDPSDARLGRVIVGYLQSPKHTQGIRFLKVDEDLSHADPSAHWTRVRIGPSVFEPAVGAKGSPPNRKLVAKGIAAIWTACSHSEQTSFYIWDLLKVHFGVTRENNGHYHQWLAMLADVLKKDPRFVIIAIDEKANIPVEWMLARDREQQVENTVRSKLDDLVSFMRGDAKLIHLTRDLVHRFFSPRMIDETYDMHAYYKAVSQALTETPLVVQVFAEETSRQAEAWLLKNRVEQAIRDQLDMILNWLRSTDTAETETAICRRCFESVTKFVSVEPLTGELERVLSEDLRFLFERSRKRWKAVPPGLSENLPAYHVLWAHRYPLSERDLTDVARERFPTWLPSFNLIEDNRFRRWRAEKWGLYEWIDINDWAYEYLRQKEMALKSDTIVAKVCTKHEVAAAIAVFTPEDDARFIRRPHERWYYRYEVSDADLERMLVHLFAAENGLTVGELVSQVIGREACDTDAVPRLAQDERFVVIADRWFAREKIFYSLTNENVEQLVTVLTREKTGIRLATLVRRALNREAKLTDAEAKLKGDARFRELLPGVWALADLELEAQDRTPIFNMPVRSDSISVVSDEEYTVAEDLTLRESQTCGGPISTQRQQVTRTLSLLDVRHGNLVVDRALAALLNTGSEAIMHFSDEIGNEFTAWVEEANPLLQGLKPWFDARDLTFGDRILLRATGHAGFFEIRPKGQRDERVFQEALQRQDIERLIESAREMHKSFHDLMIEVLTYFSQCAGTPVPLHREDIYNLVNYNRTASRNYIFSLLSLPGCPYEELRYFVSHGRGYWSFDPGKKKAFDMKMKELITQVESLEAENSRLRQSALLTVKGSEENDIERKRLVRRVDALEQQLMSISQSNTDLLKDNEHLRSVNEKYLAELEQHRIDLRSMQVQVEERTSELETLLLRHESLKQERDEVLCLLESRAGQVESLTQETACLQNDKAALKAEVERVATQSTRLNESIEHLQDQIDALGRENTTLVQEHGKETAQLSSQISVLQQQIENLEVELASDREEKARLATSQEELKRRIQAVDEERIALEAEIDALQSQKQQLGTQNTVLQEGVGRLISQVDSLEEQIVDLEKKANQRDIELRSQMALQQHQDGLIRRLEARKEELQNELESMCHRARQLQERVDGLARLADIRSNEVVQLTAQLDSAKSAVQTRLGRGFVFVSRLLGGPDLSNFS